MSFPSNLIARWLCATNHSLADVFFVDFRADDRSIRYVAEENISEIHEMPAEGIMCLAGRYFKRWDAGVGRFVSNMRDEYPDD